MDRKILIIGAGISGIYAAQLLSADSQVTVVSDENILPYYRMRIGEIVSGASPESLLIHSAEWYREHGIRIIHKKASFIDTEAKTVLLEDGNELQYDKLILAAGARPFVPSIPGRHRFTSVLRSMEDALRLRSVLPGSDSIAIIGGGILGLEAAAMIASSYSISVHVIDNGPYILSKQIDGYSSAFLTAELERRSIDIRSSAKVIGLEEDSVVLEDSRIKADIVLFSAGVRADKELAERSGIRTGRGIAVNSYLETSDESIYAIGDAAELDGRGFGLAMYAREMAAAAAGNIAGKRKPYIPSAPSAVMKIAGIDIASFGTMEGNRHSESSGDSLKTYYIDNGILKGAVLINAGSSISRIKASIGRQFGI